MGGTGQDLPISAAQLEAVFGNEHMQAIAGKPGITPENAATQVSRYLPQIVDRLTPEGTVPDADRLQKAVGDLLGR